MSEPKKKVADVIAKVQKDPAAKAELLKNPVAFMEKALDVKLPAGQTIKVIEDTSSLLHVVLPLPSGDDKAGSVILNKTKRKELVERTYRDSAFKAELLKNPDEAVSKAGVKLPAGMKVVVVEDSAAALHLVLPVPGAKDPLGAAVVDPVVEPAVPPAAKPKP
jgi:hypothetical protein